MAAVGRADLLVLGAMAEAVEVVGQLKDRLKQVKQIPEAVAEG